MLTTYKILYILIFIITIGISICANSFANENEQILNINGNTEFLQRQAVQTKARMMFNGYPTKEIETKMSDFPKIYRG